MINANPDTRTHNDTPDGDDVAVAVDVTPLPAPAPEAREAFVRGAVAALKARGGSLRRGSLGDLIDVTEPCCILGACGWALGGHRRLLSGLCVRALGGAWGYGLEAGFEGWGYDSEDAAAYALGAAIAREEGLLDVVLP